MKRKMLAFIGGIAVILALAGCSSVQTASTFNGQKVVTAGQPLAHVSATTKGLYFLCWPVVTGAVEDPGSIVFFQDTVNTASVSKMVTAKAKEMQGTKVVDLVTDVSGFSLLFGYHVANASGTVIR